jgi:hypothetical protein
MKMLSALALAAALLAGAASAQQAGTPAAEPGAQTFTGWVKIENGEIQLYETQQQLARPFARPCTSVVLPLTFQRTAGDLNRMQVQFSGHAVPWSERQTPQVMTFKGSRVANECRGETVIQADTFRILRAGG